MREYNVIDSAVSVDQLRRRLKNEELEQYGEPFTPEFVYDAIRKLPRFASMRVRLAPGSLNRIRANRSNLARSSARCRRISRVPP
jgi:hypothetical protein